MITPSGQVGQRNVRAVSQAIAQQEPEGLKVTPADLHRVARGEIDTDEVIPNIHGRLQNVPLHRH